jgi:hypothetical protein
VFIGDVKIPERPRNPDFPAPEGPIFASMRAVDHSKETRSIVRPRGNAFRLPSAAKPIRAASGQIAFGFLKKIADGAA